MSIFHLSISSWFPPLVSLLIFSFFMKLVNLFLHIYYFSVYFNQHWFHLQKNSTAPFQSLVLARLKIFLWYNRCSSSKTVAFCSAIRFTAYLFWFGFKFSEFHGTCTSILWLHASEFQAADGDTFGVDKVLMVPASSAIPP